MSNKLENYKSSGKSGSHYTIYLYDYTIEDVLTFFSKKLDFVNKSLKDKFKKKMANDIIFTIKTELENGSWPKKFNYFILANQKGCEFIPFSKSDLKIAEEWRISKMMFDFDSKFKIKYLKKLFSTDINIINFHFDNKKLVVKYVDFMKEKIIEKTTVDQYENIYSKFSKEEVIYTGLSSYLDKIIKREPKKKEYLIRKKNVQNDDIIDLHSALVESKNNIRLERDIIGNLSNEKISHKFLFGKKEITEHISGMTIKTLYIYESIYNKLYQKLCKTGEESLINFEVIIFKEKNTLENYGGMIGEKYY